MKINPMLIFLFLNVWLCVFFTKTVYAEESVPAPDPVSVLVSDPDVTSRLDAMQYTLEQIAAALAEDEPADIVTPETAPDYTSQLEAIADELQQVRENTTPVTPETPVSAFEKPFEEYSTSEVLLLCLAVGLLVGGVFFLFFRR